MVDLLQVAQLPPFLTERLEKEFTLHDFIAPDDPDAMLDEIAPKIRGILAGGMKGPNAKLINRLENLEKSRAYRRQLRRQNGGKK